ncbi:MAG TPA: hypothetical protein VE864_01310, partial [Streptosporangiaceae bacterium]|nr:hypothetical protein [Streptosporangiaceae bacterium]
MGHRGTEGSRAPEDWPGQQYAAAPWDEEAGYGDTTYASHQTGPQPQGGPARGYPPAPDQPNPVYPQGDFDSWNDAPGGDHWQGQQYAAAPWDDDDGYGSTTYDSHDTGPQDAGQAAARGPARGFPPPPGQPNPVYPQGDFDSW